ncbi:site-specific integrase, partial [[Clostridium] leptum]
MSIRRTSQYIKERGIYTDTTKTKGSLRSLKLPASVIDLLRQHKIEQSKERLKLGDQWVNT